MEKESWIGRESLRLVVLGLPFIFLFAFWDQLPGEKLWREDLHMVSPSSIGKRHLMALAFLNLLLYGAFQLRHLYRPKNKPDNPTSWRILQLLCHQLLTLTLLLAGFRALGFKLAPNLVLQYSIITLLLVLGSFLSAIPRNIVFGFRLSWILKSDYIWQKTHRFAAQVWVYASFFMLCYPGWQAHDWVFPLYVGLLVLSPISYSYLAYRQLLKTLAPPKK
jgi:uncharacterized membrane protein